MTAPKSTRRAFLQGRAAVDALQNLVGDPAAAPSPDAPAASQPPPRTCLVQIGRKAMACQFEIFLPIDRPPWADEAALDTLDLIDALEAQLTVYRETSEVSQLNRQAAQGPVVVEAGLFALLEQALDLHRQTQGAFDITAAPLVKTWGFYRRAGRVPTEDEVREALARVGSRHLALDREGRTAQFLREGIEINLGAIGKGYALDRGAALLLASGVGDFLFHGGKSSVLARGSSAQASEEPPGWTVGLRHPLRVERRLAEVRLVDQALGTSGAGAQFFYHQGRRYGHILDPRSGQPAEGMLSATVVAPTAAEADALATAFYVLGVDGARQVCQSRPDLGALLVTPGARAGGVQTHRINLGDEVCRLLD